MYAFDALPLDTSIFGKFGHELPVKTNPDIAGRPQCPKLGLFFGG